MGARVNLMLLLSLYGAGIGQAQEKLVYPNMNNVFGYIPTPGVSVGNVQYLGKFQRTRDCINACLSHHPGRCLTFTFHTLRFEGPYQGQCYGGIEEPLWSPVKMDNVDAGRIIWPCKSDMDCSLNGRCVQERCKCRTAWKGPRCDVLNLLPADRNSGYHYMEDGKNISSWGGGVLRDKQGMI